MRGDLCLICRISGNFVKRNSIQTEKKNMRIVFFKGGFLVNKK